MIKDMATPLLMKEIENNGGAIVKQQLPKSYGKIVLTLTNCLLPTEKLSSTPSQVDGLDYDTEADLRILGCELIQTAGILLKLPQVAMATGQVLFQRFYYSKSFVRHPMEATAMGCVCLASKIEEAPRRIRDVINVFNHIKQVTSGKTIFPVILDANYIALKTQVIKAERRVLKELGFCVHVKHPHKIIVIYLQLLGFESNEGLMQYSWNYMNDALRTDVFVRYHPETVACACIYLTARRLKICMPKNPSWYSIFGVSEEDIHDVCYSILRLYKRPKINSDELECVVDELRREYQETRLKLRAAAGLALISANNTPANTSNSPSSPMQQQRQKPEVSPRMKNNHSSEKYHDKEDRKRSRSNSLSPPRRSKSSKKHKRSSSSRSRSRSPSRDRRKKSSHKNRVRRSYSESPPQSPPHKISHKSSKSREKSRYESRSRSHDRDRRERSRSRSYERYSKSYHEKSKSSSGKRRSSIDGHKRSKDVRR